MFRNRTSFVLLVCLIQLSGLGSDSMLSKLGLDKTNTPPGTGWLSVPSKELLLEIHGGALTHDCRRAANELRFFLLRELIQAGYQIHLAPSFVDDEIRYYELNTPSKDSQPRHRGIMACLQAAKRSEAFDWDCLKAIIDKYPVPLSSSVDLPWSQPPQNPMSLQLARSNDGGLPNLVLSTDWSSRSANGFVYIKSAHEPAMSAAGKSTICNPSCTLRFIVDGATVFSKYYPQEAWRARYTAADVPENNLTIAVLQDIRIGLQPKVASKTESKNKK